jgi:hypothetical protein
MIVRRYNSIMWQKIAIVIFGILLIGGVVA